MTCHYRECERDARSGWTTCGRHYSAGVCIEQYNRARKREAAALRRLNRTKGAIQMTHDDYDGPTYSDPVHAPDCDGLCDTVPGSGRNRCRIGYKAEPCPLCDSHRCDLDCTDERSYPR